MQTEIIQRDRCTHTAKYLSNILNALVRQCIQILPPCIVLMRLVISFWCMKITSKFPIINIQLLKIGNMNSIGHPESFKKDIEKVEFSEKLWFFFKKSPFQLTRPIKRFNFWFDSSATNQHEVFKDYSLDAATQFKSAVEPICWRFCGRGLFALYSSVEIFESTNAITACR